MAIHRQNQYVCMQMLRLMSKCTATTLQAPVVKVYHHYSKGDILQCTNREQESDQHWKHVAGSAVTESVALEVSL